MTTIVVPAPAHVLGADPHGFAGLYIRHRSSFTAHARRYLRDPRDAEEVVQEAFLRLFLAMPELETELQALAYCRRTITNLCIDRYRADARRPRLVTLEGTPADELAEDDSGDPVVRAEDAALVREALSRLPDLHREALVKREIEEKSLPVIADELDVAEDSVKHLLFRARRNLRKLLAGTSVAPGVDAELTRGLRPVARGASGGVAGLLLLALLGLGSGPDLRAVPVVGVDLPDVLGVTAVADAVGGAVRDVVEAIVPGSTSQTSASAQEPPGGPASRRAPLLTADAPAQSTTAPGTAATPTRLHLGGAVVPPGTPQTTTVVTVVDGRPVVAVVPVTGERPPSSVPGVRVAEPGAAPGSSTGGGAGPYLPTPAGPTASTVAPGAGAQPGPPVVPAADVAARPSGSDAVPRASRAAEARQEAAEDAADRAADTAARVAKAADKSADRAADVEQAPAKADRPAQQAVEKATEAAVRAADKADRAADKAEEKAGKAEQKAADKASKAADKAGEAADRAADKAGRSAGKAAKVVAGRAQVVETPATSAVAPAPAP